MILPSRSFAVDIRSGSWMGAHRNSHWFTRQPAVAPAWRGLSPSIRVFQNRSALSADAGCEGTSTQLDCSEVAVVQLVVDDHPEVRWPWSSTLSMEVCLSIGLGLTESESLDRSQRRAPFVSAASVDIASCAMSIPQARARASSEDSRWLELSARKLIGAVTTRRPRRRRA